jgi:N-acetylglucosaminyldiphosphoundecaprenol N-acetyl-beta-D-mannosaminyltransferase
MHKVHVLGVGIDPVRLSDMLMIIEDTSKKGERALISHVNIRALNLAYEHPWFRELLNGYDYVYCDGMGVQLGAQFLGTSIPERITLADWIWPLTEMGAKENLGFYFLGNHPGVARRASDAIKEKIPEIQIGTQHGYLNLAAGNPENEAVIEKINASGAQILLVGLGMPAQEKWLRENWPRLEVNIGITCGALFEYISGDLPRGPRWMTENYLEWFWRMITAPRRYTRRYFRDIPLFAYRIVNQKWHVRK